VSSFGKETGVPTVTTETCGANWRFTWTICTPASGATGSLPVAGSSRTTASCRGLPAWSLTETLTEADCTPPQAAARARAVARTGRQRGTGATSGTGRRDRPGRNELPERLDVGRFRADLNAAGALQAGRRHSATRQGASD
jgi:hypothetical protein